MLILNENLLDDEQDDPMGAEDPENDSLIIESAIVQSHTPEEIEEMLDNGELDTAIYDEGILSEKTIIRMDKVGKKNRAKKQAIYAIAKEKNDKHYRRLVTVWKMRRMLEAKLEKKYGQRAEKRAKEMMKLARSSKSKPVRKAAEKSK